MTTIDHHPISMSLTSDTELSTNDVVHIRMHDVRFYKLPPRSIQCISLCTKVPKLALCRKDNSIEIWDVEFQPCLEKVIPTQDNLIIEALAWFQRRLYSVGRTGELIEWNLDTLRPRSRHFATGSCIWCIDVNEATCNIAVGTEEGYVNIFHAEREGNQYQKLFDKQDKRILCCKFNKTGDRLVTGSPGVVRVWDVNMGYALTKMALRRANTKQDLIVWSVQIFSDMTVVSGDSRGHITFWDGENGAQIQTQKALDADVFSISISEDEETVVCSGIDPIIRIYTKVKIKRDDCLVDRWIRTLQRPVHDFHVLSLVCHGDKIYSGSLDGFLGVSSMSKYCRTITQYGPFLKTPWLSASTKDNLILLRYPQSLEVWRLGSASVPGIMNTDDGSEFKNLKPTLLETSPKKIFHINVRNDYSIISAAISPNAKYLCYSTLAALKLFHMDIDSLECGTLVPIESKELSSEIATHMQFDETSKRLFLVNLDTKKLLIYIISHKWNEVELGYAIDIADACRNGINFFTISDDGLAFVLVNGRNIASVWIKMNQGSYVLLVRIPYYEPLITAIAFRPNKKQVLLAYADSKLAEYDIQQFGFISYALCDFGENEKIISCLLLDRRDPSIVMVQTDENLYTLQICQTENLSDDLKSANKKRKTDSNTQMCHLNRFELIGAVPLKHFVGMAIGAIGQLVVVTISPLSLYEQLPQNVQKKQFGVS